jgi:ferredoxin-type protein NapH
MMKPKERLERSKKSRTVKQFLSGALFVVLLAAGWFLPVIGYFIPLCMVAGVGVAAVKGRKWCDWYCPRGAFADTFLKTISPHRSIPAWLRGMPVRVGVLVFMMAMLTIQIVRLWPDFFAIGGFFIVLLTVTTLVGVLLALIVHQRSWCYICPIGSLSNWVGGNKYQLKIDAGACVGCKLCAKTCPMQLSPVEMKERSAMAYHADCLKCGLCVAACPKDALAFPSK